MKKHTPFAACLLMLLFSTVAVAQPANGMTTFYTNTTTALQANTACSVTKTVTLSGWLFSVSSTSNCGFNWTNTTGGDGRIQYLVGFGSLTQATFGSDDGSEFALDNLTWGVSTSSWTSKSMEFVGYKNGSPVSGATVNATTPSGTGILNTLVVNFGSNTAFNDVDEIRLAPISSTCNSILFFEDITIGTASASCTTPTLSLTGQSNVLCNGGSTGSATMSASGGSSFTYTWSPSGGNAASASGLSAGTYTCSMTNSCGATDTQTVTISQPSSLATSTAVTNALCNGANGSATVTASGGTGAYSYTWSSGPTTSVEPTLLAGTYTVKVTDANNCTSTKSVTISQPSSLVTNTAVTNALCNGGNGSATITASGGTGAYTYSWSSGATASAAVLSAGTYTAKVTDANSCTSTKSITISQPSAISTSTAVTNVLCNGGSGGATITASGGTGAYTYSWSTGATASVVTSLFAGAYTATVTDANNCTSIKSVIISQPSVLNTNTAVTNALCNGGSGSATITASGGTSPYTYSWSTSATTSFVTLSPGAYTYTISDANGCSSGTKSVTVTQPSALSTSTAVTNALCNGSSGSATITASGGTGAYTYSWSTGATTSVVALFAGSSTATVTDANNCTSIKSVTVSQPSALSTSTAVTNVLCNGGTGSAMISASGGTGAYTYSWSTGATSPVVTVSAGTYTAIVTDANNCTSTKSVTVTQPTALSNNTAVTNPLCNGGTGSATITASGGTSPYTYLWSTSATTSVVAALGAGIYTAVVTDANGCSAAKTVSITSPSALSLTASSSQASVCIGGSSTLTASGSGGTGAYTYNWVSGPASAISLVSPTITTSYTVNISDANSCTNSKTISVTVLPSATISVSGGSICAGQSFSISPSGASTYTFSSGSAMVSPTITTSYSVTGTGTNNCASSNTAVITVSVNNGPSITVNSGSICPGKSFTITPSGSATSYSYSGGGAVVTPSANASYTITGTDGAGCTNTVGAVSTVTISPAPTISASGGTICSGQSFTIIPTGANTFTISGGSSIVSPTSSASYSVTGTSSAGCVGSNTAVAAVTVNTVPIISVNSGTICSGKSFTIVPSGASTYTISGGSATVSPTANTNYTVSGTSTNGCVSTTAAISQVTVVALPTLSMSGASICPGNSFTLAPSGAATYSYLNGGPVVTPGATTSYSVIGTSSVGCVSANTVVAVVTVSNTLVVGVSGSSVICSGQSATLTANGATTYSWSSGVTTASAVLTPSATTSYTAYGVSGTCSNNVVATISVNITPTVTISGTGTLCLGNSVTLTASGANTYSWNTGAGTVSVSVNPTTTINYSVTGTATNNCAMIATRSVSVFAIPSISVNSGSICSGNSFTLNPTGANTYSFQGGNAVVTPTASANYTVTGVSGQGCAATVAAISNVTVNITPTVSVANATICSGQTYSLNPTGAGVYNYLNGGATVAPTSNASYSITGTSTAGCVSGNTAVAAISVNTLPVISASGGSICSGGNFTIVPSGALTYTITNGSSTVGTLVSPTTGIASYTITGTGINGCINSSGSVMQVTVYARPTLALSGGSVCPGYSFTLSPQGAATYSYLNGGPIVTPSVNTTYSVTGTSSAGCAATNTVSAAVSVTNTLTIGTAGASTICSGQSALLTGTGATTYSWSSGQTTSTVSLNPLVNTTYTIYGVSSTCSNSAAFTISVSPTPTVSIAGTTTLCAGSSITLTASGANTYLWSNSISTATAAVSPSASIVYTATGTAANTCTNSATVSVTVFALPNITVNSGSICAGQMFTITPAGAATYTYSGGSAIVGPTVSSTYTVTGTDANGCSPLTGALSSVAVNPLPTVSIAGASTICAGESATLTASGAGSYTWSTGNNSVSIAVNPTITATYSLTGSDANNCSNTSTVMLTVNPCVGIKQYAAQYEFGIYPNPANDQFNVVLETLTNDQTLEVYNAMGQLVLIKPLNSTLTQVRLDQYTKGIYTVKITEKGRLIGQKKLSLQ